MLDYFDSIVLLGIIGVKFYMAKNEIKNLAQYSISSCEAEIIKKLLGRDSKGKIMLP